MVNENYTRLREETMKKSMKARLKLTIIIGLIPSIVTVLLMFFLPLYLTLHDVKWLIFAFLTVCVIIFLGYLLYKFLSRDL